MQENMQQLREQIVRRMLTDMAALEPEAPTEPPCPTCHDLGMISYSHPIGHPDFGRLFRCDNPNCRVANANRERAVERRVRTSKVPIMLQRFTFQTWELELTDAEKTGKWPAYLACHQFATTPGHWVDFQRIAAQVGSERDGHHEPKNSIMLQGGLGVGKTGLAIAAVNALLEAGESAMYIRARDMLREVQGRYGRTDERVSADDMISEFCTAPVLLIDEFNIRNEKPDRLEIVETIIRSRYGNQLPTLMTANMEQDEFSAQWGERTADVIFEMAHWIMVSGPKLRKTAGAVGSL